VQTRPVGGSMRGRIESGRLVTLAVRPRRPFFDEVLARAVPSSWDGDFDQTREERTAGGV
jgi:hypothetical protein